MRIQCTCVSLRASIALFLHSPADLCNPGVLTFSHSSVYVSTVPAGPGIGTMKCQERGPRLPNYFSSCYKCPQMQHIILRHLCGHDILLAPSILLLPRKIILISKPFSSSSQGLLKNRFPDSPAHTWPPLPVSHVLIALCPALSQLKLPQGRSTQYIFCFFFEDLLCHIIGLIYRYPYFNLKNI